MKLSTEYQMIGYACDEMERLHRLTKKKQSILVEQKIVERECFDICRQYDLLSPMYEIGLNRDGCWFCPNATEKERELIRNNYPELLENIKYIISLTADNGNCGSRNNWYKEYEEQIQIKEQMKMEI